MHYSAVNLLRAVFTDSLVMHRARRALLLSLRCVLTDVVGLCNFLFYAEATYICVVIASRRIRIVGFVTRGLRRSHCVYRQTTPTTKCLSTTYSYLIAYLLIYLFASWFVSYHFLLLLCIFIFNLLRGFR